MNTPLKQYLLLRYSIPEEYFEQVYTALAFINFLGITEGQDELMICLEYHSSTSASDSAHAITQLLHQHSIPAQLQETTIVEEENWNKEWENTIEPIYVNKNIVITPSWKIHTVEAQTKIVINPQMSFGTGHHETTRMTASLLEESIHTGSFWVDAGTGTGVLAILALKCGAKRVFAFDNDEWSIINAKENIALNNIPASVIKIQQGDVHTITLPSCHGITANLHRGLLEKNFHRFYEALVEHQGILIVSGILRYDTDDIIAAALPTGFQHIQTITENEWSAIKFNI